MRDETSRGELNPKIIQIYDRKGSAGSVRSEDRHLGLSILRSLERDGDNVKASLTD